MQASDGYSGPLQIFKADDSSVASSEHPAQGEMSRAWWSGRSGRSSSRSRLRDMGQDQSPVTHMLRAFGPSEVKAIMSQDNVK